MTRGYRAAFVAVSAAAVAALIVAPALAAPSAAYGQWTLDGDHGTVAVPGSDFPVGTFTSDATRLNVPSGTSAYLSDETPFGKEFGSSRGQGYLFFGIARGNTPSTTTITFDHPAPASEWGFALGDIDADQAQVSATGPGGTPLTSSELGWQSAFNFCDTSPKPGTCTHPPFTDKPTWDPVTSILKGSGADTDGASGWFMPTTPVKSLTILFSKQSGIPVADLWIAARWKPGKPDIVLHQTAEPSKVSPGDRITYIDRVTNEGTAAEPDAEFSDDLRDVLIDAHDNHDAHADDGTVTQIGPVLQWHGALVPGQTSTVTYSVTVDNPPHDIKVIKNDVVGDGPRMTCQRGKGPRCWADVIVRLPAHKRRPARVRNLCRALARPQPVALTNPSC